jgi:sigma-54 specific flagellar transcriptional regulator A
MEAEIFGFEKGAFTGALKTTQGKFEQAHKGTLFLDEIGDMPSALQTKLLRVLENSTITRVGSTKDIKLDVRVVCATHKNLDELVTTKNFREDLLFRLNVFPINVPALVERREDIPDLINHFLKQKKRLDHNSIPHFDEEAFDALKNYSWPGNIREVRNIVERAVMFFPAQKITSNDVNNYLIKVNLDVINRNEEQTAIWEEFDNIGKTENNEQSSDESYIPVPADFANLFEKQNAIDLRRLLRDIEIVLIEAAINRNNGNTSEAAKDLKLLRTTLIEKVKKYGL